MESVVLKTIIGTLLSISFVAGCRTSQPTVNYKLGKDGKIESGSVKGPCAPPKNPYAKDLELKVASALDSALQAPVSEIELQLRRNVIKLGEYSSDGLDLSMITYEVCKISVVRLYTPEQTNRLTEIITNAWNESKRIQADKDRPVNLKITEEDAGAIPNNFEFNVSESNVPNFKYTVTVSPKIGSWQVPFFAIPSSHDSLLRPSVHGQTLIIREARDFDPADSSAMWDIHKYPAPVRKEAPYIIFLKAEPKTIIFGDLNNQKTWMTYNK